MGAALFMALTRAVVRGAAVATNSPAQCITQANRLICADAGNGMFVTLWYGMLEGSTGDLTFVNAGHNPPWFYQSHTDQFGRLERTGMALGGLACYHTLAAEGRVGAMVDYGVRLWDIAATEKKLEREAAAVAVYTELAACRNAYRVRALEELALAESRRRTRCSSSSSPRRCWGTRSSTCCGPTPAGPGPEQEGGR